MVGHFPSPHPDELLYSICARFTSRAGYSSAKSVIQELFGDSRVAVIDLPNNLDYLSTALPPGSSLTVARLINQHTLFPFFSAFLPCGRVTQLTADFRSGPGQAGYMRSGVMASRIPTPERLRLCPACAQEDESRFGEPYWHRVHQVSGVLVCPSHEALLEESEVNRRTDRDNLQFIAAESATGAVPSKGRTLLFVNTSCVDGKLSCSAEKLSCSLKKLSSSVGSKNFPSRNV